LFLSFGGSGTLNIGLNLIKSIEISGYFFIFDIILFFVSLTGVIVSSFEIVKCNGISDCSF